MTAGATISKNFLFQSIGKAVSLLVGLGTLAILTRALGAAGFGEYTTSLTFLQLFAVIIDFGLTLMLVVMISEQEDKEENLVGNILGLRLFSAAIIFCLAPLAVLPFAWSGTVKLGVAVGAIAYFLMAGASLLVGVFQKHAAMWRSALAEIINRLLLIALVALFAYWQQGVIWMIGALIISNLAWLLSSIYLARPFLRIRPRFEWRVWQEVLRRSWPIALSIIFNLIYLKGDIIFLAYFRPTAEVGYYGAAYKIIDVLTTLPVMFMGLALPILVKRRHAQDHANFNDLLQKSFNIFIVLALPLIIGTQLVAEPLAIFFAGADFAATGQVLRFLIIAVLGVFIGALYGHSIVALNLQKPMIWGYGGVALLSVIGYLLFIPHFGMYGAAWVTIFSESLIALITLLVVSRASGHWPKLLVAGKSLLASIVMAFSLFWLPALPVLVTVACGALVYAFVLMILRTFSWLELKNLILPHHSEN